MSMTLNERNPNISTIHIGTQLSSAAIVFPGIYFRKHSRIKAVHFIDTTGIVASSSNYLNLALQDNAATPVAYAAGNTKVGIAALTQLAVALSNPVGDTANNPEADVPAGTMLNLKLDGFGTALPTNGKVQVEWYPL